MKEEKPEHNNQSNIKCPYCDSEDLDSWERDTNDLETSWKEIECWDCEKKFMWKRSFDVWYETEGCEK